MINIKLNSIAALLKSRLTVFSTEDLVLLWQISNQNYLKAKIYRLVKDKKLVRLRNGLYVLDKNYNPEELANKLLLPSYISFETALAAAGIVFQYDSRIYSAAAQSRQITCDNRYFVYRKIKESALRNNIGIEQINNCVIATPERAVVDTLYLMPDFYFDNLDNIDWDLCFGIAQVFQNKSLILRIKTLKEQYAQSS